MGVGKERYKVKGIGLTAFGTWRTGHGGGILLFEYGLLDITDRRKANEWIRLYPYIF
jgi:hypothetical protein